ncbi:unnamed protein product [Symbiodinium sp. CCMP2592]|nr:unnamed protein product [Symbiodinium sp. CCMP2592]
MTAGPCRMDTWVREIELIASSQSSDDKSQAEHQSLSDSEDQVAHSAFWAPLLKRDSLANGYAVPERSTPVKLVSACAGCCAEAAAMKELGIPFQCLSMSEPVEAFRTFARANMPDAVVHLHETLREQVEGAPCLNHPQKRRCDLQTQVDLLVAGTPCNPFSGQRHKRFKPGSVANHALTSHTYKELLALVRKTQPTNIIMEQSEGFGKPVASGEAESPLDQFLVR